MARRKKRLDSPFDAAEQFLEWAETNKKPLTVRTYCLCMDKLKGSFSGKRLSEIDPMSIERHKKARADGAARVRANRELACLKRLFYASAT